MDPIKDIVHQVISNISQRKPDVQNKIQRIWQSVIGEKLLKHTSIGGLQENILIIHVDSPACLFQMNLKKRKFLDQMKEEIPDLENINFKIGKVK